MPETTPTPEVERNYSIEQETAITAAAPLNLEKAKVLADEFGKSWRSVVAKAVNMGLEYQPKPKPEKRPAKITKSEIVEGIEGLLEAGPFTGLSNATLQSLVDLSDALAEALY